MSRVSLIAAVAIVACAVPVHAQNDTVARGPAPDWVKVSEPLPVPADASGAVFVRRQDFVVRLGPKGQEQYTGYRIRVLHANALQLGNVALTWNPAAGAPIVHGVTVHRGSEAIDVLKTTRFEVLRREDQLEAARLDGLLTAVLRVPDLRVGDELEVAMTIIASDPTLGKTDSGVLMLAPDPAPGRYHLALTWDASRNPGLKMAPAMAAVAKRQDRSLDLVFDNPPTLSPPKDAPGRYQWIRTVEFSDFSDWPAVSRHFAPLYRKAATLKTGSPIRQEASRIAAASAAPIDRARAALKLVQQDVRYIYVGLNGGNLTPASAEETWQRRYGDCKGKTALLLALLGELGIAAEPVLVNTTGADDGLDARLPSPGLFDHVVVRAQIDGKSYWMDGTLPPVAGPSPVPALPVEWVLPLAMEGRALEHIPWTMAAQPDEISLYEIDARAGFDAPAKITTTRITRGVEGLKAQLQFSAIAPAQLLQTFRQQLIGDTFQSIETVQWRYDEKAAASVLTISGTGAVGWDDDGGGRRSLALPGGGFSPPEKRIRAADQDQTAPYVTKPEFSCHVTTVRLPATTQPGQWSSKASFDTRLFGRNFYRAFDLRDGAIRMIRASRVEQREITPAEAQRDNAKIAAFDNSMGWISYDPADRKGVVGTGRAVPATYDRDWTTSDVPCVATASK